MIPLCNLLVGKSGVVTTLLSEGESRRRFLDLGLTPNTIVKAERLSPSGNPIAFNIRGTIIALRLEEAKKVLVETVDWR
ncbi:FeoA family protein [Sporanaerobacter acetigenes]|uniref:Ferrous iron transport protein A n=1 Tax=Sporanaerobacter acetigenes DSM 13106 TaxID=1123281 RepID=A0A1M5XBQ1_9FIRM|nr:FeoA family protein [Sporanaerobacter acetigenes]SHH97169.1 ferrous iron transport protein A [Sporanaerobacter acetigenes DSM 13106]